MANLVGTPAGDTLTGSDGSDTLKGLAGNDTLVGNGGDDALDGGLGDDSLDGGLGIDAALYDSLAAAVTVDLTKQGMAQNTGGGGTDTLNAIEEIWVINSSFADTLTGDAHNNRLISYGGGDDRLDGGAGDDVVYADMNPDGSIPPHSNSPLAPTSTLTLLGGTGNDQVVFLNSNNARMPYIDTVLLDGGDGNDLIMATGGGTTTISAGAGDDTVYLYTLGGSYTVTLGTGSDTLHFGFFANDLQASQGITVTDFTVGVGGDVFDIQDWLNGTTLSGHMPGGDPIAGGWVRLLQSGADTLFQVDADGGGNAFRTVVTFQNTTAADIISDNIIGFDLPPIDGTGGNDNLNGTEGSDTINGLAGNDEIHGNGGNDLIFGGDGDDILTGGPGSDTLTGGAGNDLFRDSLAGFDGDRIGDFSVGDRLQITDVDSVTLVTEPRGFGIILNGILLLPNPPVGYHFESSALAGGGVELTLVQNPHNTLSSDFNGDGHDDLLWRNDNGQMSNWLGNANGGFSSNDAHAFASVPTEWKIADTGDFNGDGRFDVLWRNSATGQLSDWLGQADGGFTPNDGNALTQVATAWQVVGTGDFNGDGKDDLLWRNTATGQLSDWLGQANGGFTSNDANAFAAVPNEWKVAGTGDFNGDGRDDILWRNAATGQMSDWLGQANGGFTSNDANAFASAPNDWKIAGTGDFNGDGRDDILWRNAVTGQMSDWLGQANGGFVSNDANAFAAVPNDWQIAGTGDFNGDGRSDIVWRNIGSGALSDWLGQANGGFTGNDANALVQGVPTSWHIQIANTAFV